MRELAESAPAELLTVDQEQAALADLNTRIFYAQTGVESLAEAANYWRNRARRAETALATQQAALRELEQTWRERAAKAEGTVLAAMLTQHADELARLLGAEPGDKRKP